MYQNIDFNKGPLHSISSHISLNRFQQLKRNYHISCPESNERNGYYLPSNKIQQYKLEPLASSIQASCQRYYSPSSNVSINELIVQCYSRYVSSFYLATPLITLDLCIHIRCQRNQSSKGIKFMESQTIDIYTIGFGAPRRRDYKIYSITQLSPRLVPLYSPLRYPCPAKTL